MIWELNRIGTNGNREWSSDDGCDGCVVISFLISSMTIIWQRKINLKLTPPYISIPYCSITQKESIQNDPSVAAVNGYYYINYYIKSIYPSEKITYYDTEKEIIQAVKNGKQDIAYVNCFLAGSLLKYLEYRDLILNLTTRSYSGYQFGISNFFGRSFVYSIINKEIKYLGY